MTDNTDDLPLDDDGGEAADTDAILAGRPLEDAQAGDAIDDADTEGAIDDDPADDPQAAAEPEQPEPVAEQPQEQPEPVDVADDGRHRPTWVEPIKYDDGTPAPLSAVEARVQQLLGEIDSFEDEIDDITTQGMSGDLSVEEVRAKQRETRAKIKAHRKSVESLTAHIQEVRHAERANAMAYAAARDDFFRTPAGKAIAADDDFVALLDRAIARVAKSDAAAGKSYSWLVDTAGEQVAKKIGLGAKAEKPEADKEPPKLRAVSSKKDIPRTLGSLPAAAGNSAGGGEFAAIDAERDPMKRAEMLQGLSDAKRERYLRRA